MTQSSGKRAFQVKGTASAKTPRQKQERWDHSRSCWWGSSGVGKRQDGEKAGHLGRDNSGKPAGVGLRRAWRLDCQVLEELTLSSGPVSAVQGAGSLRGEPAVVSWTSKAVARDHSCLTVSGNIWRPRTQNAKNSGELPREDPMCDAVCGPSGPRTSVPQVPHLTLYHCRPMRSI